MTVSNETLLNGYGQRTRSRQSDMNDTVVIYHYYEKNHSYIQNFLHFLRFGYSTALDFVVVIAGKCSLSLPKFDNLTYLLSKNSNYDYGGYSQAIRTIDLS